MQHLRPLRAALVLVTSALAVLGTAVLPAQAAVAPGTPIGFLDTAVDGHTRPSAGNLHLTGWTIDGDEPTSHPFVDVYVDGAGSGRSIADVPRADLDTLAPNDHGFDIYLNVSPGTHTACVYAIGIGPGGPPDGDNPLLGCKQVVVFPGGEPIGALDSVIEGPGQAVVRGWASDVEDAAGAALGIDVYVDLGTAAVRGFPFPGATTRPRPDVPEALPGRRARSGLPGERPAQLRAAPGLRLRHQPQRHARRQHPPGLPVGHRLT